MAADPLLHIDNLLEAIRAIDEDVAGLDAERFAADRRARQLAERNLEIISEASRHLPRDLKEREPDIPWDAIAGIGNVLRHDYHRADPLILWETCRTDLPPLRHAARRMRHALTPGRPAT